MNTELLILQAAAAVLAALLAVLLARGFPVSASRGSLCQPASSAVRPVRPPKNEPRRTQANPGERLGSCSFGLRSGLWLVVLSLFWLVTLNHLRVEWFVNPQYSYAWAVPFLCGYMLYRRWQDRPCAKTVPSSQVALVLCATFAFMFLPTLVIEQANPEWRFVSWMLTCETVGLTLAAVWCLGGAAQAWHLCFPVAFLLAAVPWLRPVEASIVQALSNLNATATVELAALLGIPALGHGSVIETPAGMVGIDEACSGIRSLQATLMLSLAIGELYRLNARRRLLLAFAGFLLAMLFNLARTTLLVWVASEHGLAAMDSWHDLAGTAILVACFACVWALGRLAAEKRPAAPASCRLPPVGAAVAPLCLGAWLALTMLGTELWYRSHERNRAPTPDWSVQWPRANPTFKDVPISARARALLRFNEGECGTWQNADGARWQMFYFRWLPGRAWVQLVSDHNPGTCLPAAGRELRSTTASEPVEVNGLQFRFSIYKFSVGNDVAYVFYSVSEDGAKEPRPPAERVTAMDRLASVWQGRRNPGQRVLEVAVWGIRDEKEAQAALVEQLEKLVVRKTEVRGQKSEVRGPQPR